jgi:O-antigen/teichoic acid export membrane protein
VVRYVVRRRVRGRGHRQSLFIAGLAAGWVLAGAMVAGLPRTWGLALAMTGAAYVTVFLVVVLDELRRHGLGINRDGSP